jgi:hypothetical protein
MLSRAQLLTLQRRLRDRRVLSVYLHGAATDPAERFTWRTDLDRSLRDLRRWLNGSTHEERETFERSVRVLEHHLEVFADGLPVAGWAGFIADGVVQDMEVIPVPMPTIAVWSTGMCVGPYIRALKVTRPVLVVVVDSKDARVYRSQLGRLELIERIHAHATIDSPAHMGDAPRVGFRAGVRGETGHDAVQRARAAGTERMLARTSSMLVRYAGLDAGVVVGGTSEMASRLVESLVTALGKRVLHQETLHASASEADVAEAARAGASALRNAMDLTAIVDIVQSDSTHSHAALGPAATRRALDRHAVRSLYVTGQFLEAHMSEAEDAVRAALDQGADVEYVADDAARTLDTHGGLAARLRFRTTTDDPTTGDRTTDRVQSA